MEAVADIASDEKRRMLYEALGFLPDGDELDLYGGKRPELRIKDLKSCAGAMVELVVRVVDARQRVTYNAALNGGNGHGGPRGFGGYGASGEGAGEEGEAEGREPAEGGWGGYGSGPGGAKYFYVFEDETGLLEGVGETRCLTSGTPPVCCLRGEIRKDGEGIPKIIKCSFLRTF
jgi:DNA polymerase-3 subunit alpha/error-prone DNA polymerase